MAEVHVSRVARPFLNIPYDSYIQSPIGLVPKDEKKTRLIFHLSYDFNKKGQMDPAMRSFNFNIAEEFSTVKYWDLDYAIRTCVRLCKKLNDINVYHDSLHLGKTDLKSTFRLLPGLPSQRRFLIMKARHPHTGIVYCFVDKCLPFGAHASCYLFQEFSNALQHIIEQQTGK